MSTVIRIPSMTWLEGVAAAADLPASGNTQYDARVAASEETIYMWLSGTWVGIAGGGGGGVTTVGAFGAAPNTGGASISGSTITMQPADATRPGGVTAGTQSFGGAKTFVLAPAVTALTASRAMVTDGSKVLASSAVTGTELGYVSGVTSAIQTQFTAKAPLASPAFTTSARFSYATATTVPYLDASKDLVSSAVTPTELGYVSGVTSALQTQIDAKVGAASPTFSGTVTMPSGTVTSSAWDTGTSTFTSNSVAFTAKANLASPTFTGTVTMPDASAWTSSGLNVPDLKPITFASQTNVAIYHDTANTTAGALVVSYAGSGGYIVFAKDKNVTSNSTLDFIVGDSYTGINRTVRFYGGNNLLDIGRVSSASNSAIAGPRNIFTGTGVLGPRGSVSACPFSFWNNSSDGSDTDVNTGMYSPAADQVALAAGGAQVIHCIATAAQFPLGVTLKTGANTTIGTATLSSGTATVSTTAVKTGAIIMLTLNTPGGTLGVAYSAPVGSIVNATSFVINAVDATGAVLTTDTSTINWTVFNTY